MRTAVPDEIGRMKDFTDEDGGEYYFRTMALQERQEGLQIAAAQYIRWVEHHDLMAGLGQTWPALAGHGWHWYDRTAPLV